MVLTKGTAKDVGFNPEKMNKISKTLSSWVERDITRTVCVLVARKGKIVLKEAHGLLDNNDAASKLTTDAIYPLASLSKPLTAACLLLLMDDGMLDPANLVNMYIPEFSGKNKDTVSIHHCLTHTTGIDEDEIRKFKVKPKNLPPIPKNMHPWIHEQLYKIYNCPQKQEPGKFMHYSGSGYTLIAEIIRRLTGKNLGEFAKERLFDPLGMESTFFIVPDDVVPRIVRRKDTDPRRDWFSKPEWLKCPSAPGGAFSNINDMAVFGQMLLNKGVYNNKRILSTRAVELMTQNQIPGIKARYQGQTFNEGSWSYGWNIKGNKIDDAGYYRSSKAFCHAGLGGVFLLVDPTYELVFANFNLYIENSFRTKCLFTNLVISAIEE